ncbi:hypothetical protein B0H13DRAFT_2544537 [Mycena leptocephala]|nr:hypothetical protein B0H13DRAFT_2544537 [Mycena leptocephala]
MLNLLSSVFLGITFLSSLSGVHAVAGVTTFNDYTTQSGVACSGFSPVNSQGNGIFSAAMADLSPLWTGARCTGSMNAANCNGRGACVNCVGRSYLPHSHPYTTSPNPLKASARASRFAVLALMSNVSLFILRSGGRGLQYIQGTGSLDGETSGACSGATIKVKIIDACPATHPANYCKSRPAFGGTIPNDEACEASGTNALDIATTARGSLSSFKGNLRIDIESTGC